MRSLLFSIFRSLIRLFLNNIDTLQKNNIIIKLEQYNNVTIR